MAEFQYLLQTLFTQGGKYVKIIQNSTYFLTKGNCFGYELLQQKAACGVFDGSYTCCCAFAYYIEGNKICGDVAACRCGYGFSRFRPCQTQKRCFIYCRRLPLRLHRRLCRSRLLRRADRSRSRSDRARMLCPREDRQNGNGEFLHPRL